MKAMAKPDLEKLTDHEYDGIREFDNPCPTWWHLVFFGTFVFSVIYFVYVHVGTSNWTVSETYNTALAENLKLRFAEIGELTSDEPTLVRYMGESDWLAIGKSVYQGQCKSCHGAEGEGLVGPNLTDDSYKNVKTLVDVARVVEEGAAAGSMPAWKNRLHPNETVLVSAYVASLRGLNIPGPGDAIEQRDGNYKEIPPWPAVADLQTEEGEVEQDQPPPSEEGSEEDTPSAAEDV
jgi:cytochrome c oxidase cbb3-type subunit 3